MFLNFVQPVRIVLSLLPSRRGQMRKIVALRLPYVSDNGVVKSITTLETQAVVSAGSGIVKADLEVLYGFNGL